MSKLEIVRSLSDSQPQLQIVQSVRELQQAVQQMHQDLQSLPSAIATETAQTLEPLSQIQRSVAQALQLIDTVTAAQRRTLDELTKEMSTSAAQSFQQQAGKLDATISSLTRSVSTLDSRADSMLSTMREIERLPGRLAIAQKNLTEAASELTAAANQARPRWWKQALGLVLAGVVGGLLVLGGQTVLSKPAQPSAVQQQAAWANAVWNKATPAERAAMNQIAARPGP